MSTIPYLTMLEMLKVLAEAKKVSNRNWCLALFAFRFGLRATELSLMSLEDVKDGHCDVRRLKGSEHTRDEITSDPNPLLDAKKALAAWLRERQDTGSVFLFTSRLGSGLKRRAIYDIFEDAAFSIPGAYLVLTRQQENAHRKAYARRHTPQGWRRPRYDCQSPRSPGPGDHDQVLPARRP